MSKVYSNITLPLTKQTVIQTIEMPLGDTGRGLKVILSDDIINVNQNTELTTATLWGVKPSGKEVNVVASSVIAHENSNSYSIIFEGSDVFSNLIAEEGIVKCTITVSSDGVTISTFRFNIDVKENIANESKVMSTQEFQSVVETLDRISEKEKKVNDLLSKLEQQAKLTVNVRYGKEEPTVLPTDKQGDLYIRLK